MDRVDDLARRLRAGGDARTETQLRSDVALDPVLYGWTAPAGVPTGSAATFRRPTPPARVTVVVSMSTLLGVPERGEDIEEGPAVAELPGYGFVGGVHDHRRPVRHRPRPATPGHGRPDRPQWRT